MKKQATPTKPDAFGEYANRVMKKIVGRPAEPPRARMRRVMAKAE